MPVEPRSEPCAEPCLDLQLRQRRAEQAAFARPARRAARAAALPVGGLRSGSTSRRRSSRSRRLPPDIEAFCREAVAFCPDVLHQGYGAAAEMIDEAPELAALAAGLDPADPDFALRLMARDLSQRRRLLLWWD